MVSKSKFLAVVLSGLVLAGGGRALTAEGCAPPPGNQPPTTATAPKNAKVAKQPGKSITRKSGTIQDQEPVTGKSKPGRKTGAIQDQGGARKGPRRGRIPDAQSLATVKAQKKPSRQQSAPVAKKSSAQEQDPMSAKSKPAAKSGSVQDQEPARPKLKIVKADPKTDRGQE
jgi:hypothetical protein